MQFSQFLAIATFAAMAYAAALPAPEAAPVAAPNADAEADPGLFTALLREGSHCTEGDWPCDN
ncbi:uncharacterized protein N7503_005586 [Penicillium pulvis]|uniref:Uncharacterized protein n=1 Tax=Penicillium frequentans TaxID=3151616 RepID=A0AAD6D1N2_9EURO|nr:uncharacterized protein N7503_005586 [Penicillium pulvis]KAJ5546113.1 hypothetical protein N7494_003698 [Penicillium glabrum]KAJ5803136.1 hypothetical protein N7503_005586 [Penicillium pulvis]